ncbi:MAG: hypothetical protein KVP17_000605, partial [Porospora cf. gigantea B]|uniref:uncharacterized protein n=1 Tax=Porospora cf. gigantea B TaxID=2853592 RepID=UPI003571BBBF
QVTPYKQTDRHSGVPTLAPVTLYVVDVQTDDNALIGKVSTYISQITVPPLPGQSASATAKPKWLKLKGGRGFQERTGDILVALDLIRPQYATVVPPPVSSPPLRKFGLMISHVGLRNLIRTSKPASLLMSFLGGQQEAEPIKLPIVQMLLPDYTNLGSDLVETWLEWQPSGYSDPTTVNKKYLSGTTPLSNFDWFFVLHADVVLPRDPVYDPFLVLKFYDSSARRRNIIGEGCVRLLDLLPTVKSVATTLMAVEPLDDYSRVFDPRKLLQLSLDLRQQMMARQLQQGSGTMRALGVDVLEEAENKENEDANADEKALKAFIEDDTEKPDDWIHPKGLPFQLLDAYASIVRAGLKVHRISKNMVTLNVRVPRNYLLTASGPSSRSALKDRINRISGTIEQITADVPWQVVPLTRRVEGKLLCTGQSRIVVGIKYKEAVKYMGRKSATSASRTPGYLQDERVMYKKLRGNLPPRLHIRLYVLNGVGITAVPGQISGPLNPYLVFYCGDQKSSARQVAPKATNNPSWYYVFEREVNMPEQAVVEIAVWQKQDEDDPRRDVRIGSGKIDLETRWLSDAWQSLKNRRKFPYETLLLTRTLDGLGGCGSVEFLLEAFLPAESASWVPRDLKQADAGFVEVRVVVWGVRAANIALTGKESLDALVKISVDCPQYKGAFAAQQETDIHFNSTNGNAVFNWRCVFPQIELPGGMCLLQLSLYDDRGPIAAPCFIGEANLDLRRYLAQCLKQGAKLEYDLEAKLNNDQQKPGEVVGYIQCTVQIVPQRDATEVGLGRGEPNTDPSLTKPSAGRKWSDWLSSGAKQNANKWYRRFQIAFLILGFLALFVIFFLIPGLFWQVKPISTIP